VSEAIFTVVPFYVVFNDADSAELCSVYDRMINGCGAVAEIRIGRGN
jgi:hypothetical protein